MKGYGILLLCYFGLIAAAWSQQALERRYTVQDGLAVTEVQAVKQDRPGYLWMINTQNYLSRYDGNEFVHYPDLAPIDLPYSRFSKTISGDLFARHIAGDGRRPNLTLLRGDTIHAFTEFPAGTVVSDNFQTKQLVFATLDSVYYYDAQRFTRDSAIGYSIDLPLPSLQFARVQTDGTIILSTWYNQAFYQYYATGPNRGQPFPKHPAERYQKQLPQHQFLYVDTSAQMLVIRNQTGKIKQSLSLKDILAPPARVRKIDCSGDCYLVINTGEQGNTDGSLHELWTINTAPQLRIQKAASFFFPPEFQFHPCLTEDGSFWVGDHTGLRRIRTQTRTFRHTSPDMVSGLHAIAESRQGEIFFGGYGTGFAKFADGQLARLTSPPFSPLARTMPGSLRDRDGNLFFILERNTRRPETLLKIDAKGQARNYMMPDETGRPVTGFHLQQLRLDAEAPLFQGQYRDQDSVDVAVMGLTGVRHSDDNAYGRIAFISLPVEDELKYQLIGRDQGIHCRNVLCTVQDQAGRIWFGHSRTGMGYYDVMRDTAITWVQEQAGDPGAISMVVDEWGTLWLGTLSGVYYIPRADTIPFQDAPHLRSYTHKLDAVDIPDNYVAALGLDEQTLIIGHAEGVSFLNLDAFYQSDQKDFPLITFTTGPYGMGAAEQNALLIDHTGQLWLGTDEGALQLDHRSLIADTTERRFRRWRFANDQGPLTINADHQINVPKDDRSFELRYYLSPDEQLRGDAIASVLLINQRGDTLEMNRRLPSGALFRRNYLDPGEYRLVAQLRHHNQIVDKKEFAIDVPKKITEHWWSLPGLILLIASVIIAYFRIRYLSTRNQLIQEQHKLKEEQMESALQRSLKEQESLRVGALVSTLNPHFITNVMQWIQSTLRQKGKPEDIVAITDRLSSNIRTMFVNSYQRKAGHELRKEFQMIQYYLEAVNLQYEDRYTFQLPPPAEIDRLGDYQVLLLQLQVHVENAVDHGLRMRKESTGIKINLQDDDDYLYISIEDDGAGFTRAAQSAKIGSRKGRKMLDELQDIFNQKNDKQLVTQISTDLYPDPHKPGQRYGTRIELTIPKTYSYAIANPSR